MTIPTVARRGGRPPVTTHAELANIALQLFSERGFDEVTVDDVAAAAGISRRTLFRYYDSKNDLVWGEFEDQLQHMRDLLCARPATEATMESLRVVIVDFNTVPAEASDAHRRRMALILETPALQAHSALRYRQWRDVVVAFVSERTGTDPTSLTPQLTGHVLLGAAVTAYEQWLSQPGTELPELIDAAVRAVSAGVVPVALPLS